MDREIAAKLAEIRGLVDQAAELQQMKEALRMMCDLLEVVTENVEYLNEGEDGDLVSFH